MRADRLLTILLLLQVHRRMTVSELAKRLEVSERTIYRDMEALSAAGVPVVAARGAHGGWGLLEGYQTTLTGLNLPEIQTLFLPKPRRLLADLGLNEAYEAALTKLLAALPSAQRCAGEYVRQRIHVDGAGWHSSEESVPYLLALQEAIWQERRLNLTYQLADGRTVERLVDPLGLVVKGSVWYLVAWVEDGVRTYRVSRVQQATISDQPCVRPDGFDLAACWEQSVANFKASLSRYQVIVRMAPAVLPKLHYAWRYVQIEQVDPPDAKGWVTVAVLFAAEEEACEYLLSLGPEVEVLEPLELRDKVIDLAERIVALYAQRPRAPEGQAD